MARRLYYPAGMLDRPERKLLTALPAGGARVTVKMIGIGLLVLLLLIPLAMIGSLVTERLRRRNEAVGEITATWGGTQTVVGPVLGVPFQYPIRRVEQRQVNGIPANVEVTDTAEAVAYFLPRELRVEGRVVPQLLHRGIYDAVVYAAELAISGHFDRPAVERLDPAEKTMLWEKAFLTISVSDLRGTGETITCEVDGTIHEFEPGSRVPGFPAGLHVALPLRTGANGLEFRTLLKLHGSTGLNLTPVGIANSVRLSSPWPDPSFRGAFLPAERTVTATGFDARWAISYYGRTYPQEWTTIAPGTFDTHAVGASLFGADFLFPVDAYRLTERSVKYGLLIVALVFLAFFLFEMLARLLIHPFQYTLVGSALCLFFLALLALSEFWSFGAAYAAGAGASTLLISWYAGTVLRGGRRALGVAAGLAAVYAFLYATLQLQDYALLIGTCGLFAALALVMLATRRISWYAPDLAEPTPPSGVRPNSADTKI